MNAPLRRLGQTYERRTRPPPPLLPSEWGAKHYVISKGPMAGKLWSCDGGWEFQRGILDGLYGPLDPGEEIREGVLFKGAKAGCTLLCDVGTHYWPSWQRKSSAVVAPRKPDSQARASESARTIAASPAMRAAFINRKGRDKLALGGAGLLYRSAETDRDLVDWESMVITGDESDRWVQNAGFNQASMLEERQGNHLERIMVNLSTPTIPDFGVHLLWKNSDQRSYHVRCPLMGCGAWQVLEWGKEQRSIVWDDLAESLDAKVDSSRFICLKCGKTWSRLDRARANASGEWVAADRSQRRRGFAISRLYVPTSLPREFTKKWLEAQHDVGVMREFMNQKLGLPFLADIGNLDTSGVQRVMSSEVVWEQPPSGYTRIFAGVDVQGAQTPLDYVWEVRSYDDSNNCALIAYGIARGIEELAAVLEKKYGGREVQRALIDISDGHHKADVEEACERISCLEAARFDWQAKVPFARVRRERLGGSKRYSMSGWSVGEDYALDDNLIRFFERGEKLPTIVIARNPMAGREKEFISHYTLIRRVREETANGPIYKYRKLRAEGVDYPFAGALAEIARRVAGAPEGKGAVGRVSKVVEATRAEAAAEPEQGQQRQRSAAPARDSIRIIGKRGGRYF